MFDLKTHPKHKWYSQCLDFKFSVNRVENPELYRIYEIGFLIYQILFAVFTFFLPLLVIIVSYTYILIEIAGKKKTPAENGI